MNDKPQLFDSSQLPSRKVSQLLPELLRGRPGRHSASEQLKTVQTQLEVGNGTGSGPGSAPQISPKAEQFALIEQDQRAEEALEAGFELTKARLGLLRALGHMDDWLRELRGK